MHNGGEEILNLSIPNHYFPSQGSQIPCGLKRVLIQPRSYPSKAIITKHIEGAKPSLSMMWGDLPGQNLVSSNKQVQETAAPLSSNNEYFQLAYFCMTQILETTSCLQIHAVSSLSSFFIFLLFLHMPLIFSQFQPCFTCLGPILKFLSNDCYGKVSMSLWLLFPPDSWFNWAQFPVLSNFGPTKRQLSHFYII